jgi:hypothetical protein
MPKVCTYNLSEDFKDASTEYGQRELGEVTLDDVQAVLEWFLLLDPVRNMEAEPYVSIEGEQNKVTVRLSGGKLFMTQARASEQGSMVVEIPDVLKAISAHADFTHFTTAEGQQILEPRRPTSTLNQGIGLTMLLLGLALNGYTVYSALFIDSVHKDPSMTLISDPDQLDERRRLLAGSYATGNEAGDRMITLFPNGKLEIQEYGNKGRIRRQLTKEYLPGTSEGRLLLRLKPHGSIEVVNRDTLLFYGDTYRRK